MNPSNIYLAIRTVDVTESDGRPVLPESWGVSIIGGGAPVTAWEMRKPDGQILVVVLANIIGPSGLYAVAGDRAYLETIPDAAPGREVWRRAQQGPGIYRTAARAWPWWRCDVTERDAEGNPTPRENGAARQLLSTGTMLPDPTLSAFPWDLDADGAEVATASAVRRVHALTRPILTWTVAGLGLHSMAEDEEDRG